VLLLGGLDGRSLAGAEAVLAAAWRLLSELDRLRPDVTVVAVPWASPDGLAAAAAGAQTRGANERPTDEDRDGRVDEDPPDDVDGDGFVVEMLLEDPFGRWTLHENGRNPVLAAPGDHPRYRRVQEGKDDDGDGAFNEDPVGGVDLDRSFPVGWRGPADSWLAGELPLSEPAALAIARLALARRTAVVILFQGNHGWLAHPGGSPSELRLDEADRPDYSRLAQMLAAATGRPNRPALPLAAARAAERPGAALDWFYAVPGALALEVAPWGPEVALGAIADPELEAGAADDLWIRWLDDVRGGIGFVPWHRVDLAGAGRCLVGGWQPRTRLDPPDEELPRALAGLADFVLAVVDALPRIELAATGERDGNVCRIRARALQQGRLPTGLAVTGRSGVVPAGELTLELALAPGARLLAGAERTRLGRLAGGVRSEVASWLVLAPPGAVFTLRASTPWSLDVERELVP